MKLKGMTWNHERGIKPLVLASEIFKQKYSIEIEWDARSLSDFEIFPLDELAEKYDMIMIDHPHIGVAARENLLLPLEDYLNADFLLEQENGSVGLSYKSYSWNKSQYAIPLDAAAQVSVRREDLLSVCPFTWDDVFNLPANLPKGQYMAIPLVAQHVFSSFFTLCSHFDSTAFWSDGSLLDQTRGQKALDYLERLIKISHPESSNMDPIIMLNMMIESDEIVYSPLVYGYSNYSRTTFTKKILTFADMPSSELGPQGSMIGGVGLSLTSKCRDVDSCLKFLQMIGAPDFQKNEINLADGQPGHILAWQDKKVNKDSNNFFINTLKTLQMGSLRPRFDGVVEFQKQAGTLLCEELIKSNIDKKSIINKLNLLFKDNCRI